MDLFLIYILITNFVYNNIDILYFVSDVTSLSRESWLERTIASGRTHLQLGTARHRTRGLCEGQLPQQRKKESKEK